MHGSRPLPPPEARLGPPATAAPELAAWLFDTFVAEGAPLENEDHEHLADARIACLWVGLPVEKQGRLVLGEARLGMPRLQTSGWPALAWSALWSRLVLAGLTEEHREACMEDGELPDFVIAVDAAYWADCDDDAACALAEHELYHCAQRLDAFGSPRFNQITGRPIWRMRPHDVEEFVGVARRYGARASGLSALARAIQSAPEVDGPTIAAACGTCLAR